MEELEIKNKYEKIGGWLYLLCFLLIFGSPIRNIFTIYTEFAEASIYFKEIKGLENFVYIESISIAILMALSVWSGISLVLIKPYAVRLTKIYLVLFLINGLVQNLFPEFVGLDPEFTKGMEYQMKVNTISAILVFGIWFMYLSISERVENTYSKSKEILNTEYKIINKFTNKFSILIDELKKICKIQIVAKIKKIDIKNLSSDEIIISSIITGTSIALIIGYIFGETNYFDYNGNRVNAKEYMYKEFHFNYLLGITSAIIFGCISYIYLNRKNNKNE
jgi:hypothetical protein